MDLDDFGDDYGFLKENQGSRKRIIIIIIIISLKSTMSKTVDGSNPAPPGMYETLYIIGYLPYQLVQDLLHQQYYCLVCDFVVGFMNLSRLCTLFQV